jgi:short-subunit dehydrogenase
MRTSGKHVLITGATSGIGFELAKLFAKDKYNIIAVARSQSELDATSAQLRKEHGVEVITIAKDLFEPQNAFQVYDEIKKKGITIDVLVNNAGHGHYGEFVETDLSMELSIINLNISSLVILTKLFITDMVKKGEGKILNLSSIASKSPGPWQSVYHGTKAFVQSFTEAVRYEVKDKGVTLTALLPGATDTDFFHKAGMEESKIVQDESKLADPAKVAKDGYDALMAGKDMVVSGIKNKLQVAMGSVTSDENNAAKMAKQQEPATKDK